MVQCAVKPSAINFPGGKFILWACKHAEDKKHACNYVLCNECKESEEGKQGRSRRKRGALTTVAACEHDVFSLIMKEDTSYYTKIWREKHRASQEARRSSLFCLPLTCSGCGGEIENQ